MPSAAAALFAYACTAPESGNSASRCDDNTGCGAEQYCYRGYCVEEAPVQLEPQSDAGSPLLEVDAGSLDASPDALAAPTPSDAETAPVDASAADATSEATADATAEPVADAAAEATADAAAEQDAGRVPDAGVVPCLNECRPGSPMPGPAPAAEEDKICKRCVQDQYGKTPEQLCGKAPLDKSDGEGNSGEGGSSGEDQDKSGDENEGQGARKALCIALCLGAASTHPSCMPGCGASTCGGEP